MPRKPRLQAPDVLYHVTSRGVDKRDIFVGTRTYVAFIDLLDQTVRRYEWICHAYCLMRNHFHLVVETPQANISAGMRFLKGEYASWFNVTVGREGALYERRFHEVVAENEAHAIALIRYLALNPVRACWVPEPEDWLWSSYAPTIGLAPRPRFLSTALTLGLFGGGTDASGRFSVYVAEAIGLSREVASRDGPSGFDPNWLVPVVA
jgi:REP element-mobilizing transposase RayT